MNDPHVQSLHYKIGHSSEVDFTNAARRDHAESGFSVRIENSEATILMIDHYASERDARAAVEPFLRTWELSAALAAPLDQFQFFFASSQLVDRRPNTADRVLFAEAGMHAVTGMQASTLQLKALYPKPPRDLGWDPEIGYMLDRFKHFHKGACSLNDATNFCLTVLEFVGGGPSKPPRGRGSGGRRGKAANHFQIDVAVLNRIGELAATKGGTTARKREGATKPLTLKETEWLEKALKVVIRRAAEIKNNPTGPHTRITMRHSDLN
jgi:hypothetical protein